MTTNIGYDDKYPPGQYKELSTLGVAQNKGLTKPVDSATVDNTLQERGNRYGKFSGHALATQQLKHMMHTHSGWHKLSDSQAEALDMIAHKIGRILNGDPNYADSWHDIAGYATLVDNQLNGKDI